MKISDQTLKMINELTPGVRRKVDKVIRGHVHACEKEGSPVENLERVFIEAIEIVKLEEREEESVNLMEGVNRYEPVRRYEQYRSPREL